MVSFARQVINCIIVGLCCKAWLSNDQRQKQAFALGHKPFFLVQAAGIVAPFLASRQNVSKCNLRVPKNVNEAVLDRV